MPSKKKGQTDSDMGSEKGDNGSSYGTLRDEGMHFVHVQLYQKAVESFTGALDLNKEHQKDDPKDDKLCLVTRAKCYLQLGNAEKALADAEEALELDKCYIRALLMKAEALYQMGDFETALVFFHRGHRERQELSEFRLGIQKAQEAINNSIGTPESVKLDTTGDLSFFEKQDSSQGKKGGKTYSKPGAQKSTFKERERPKSAADSKTIRQLLEELYHDKEYLEKLFSDEAFTKSSPATGSSTNRENEIRGRVCDGLEYLNSRADFWRQQKPMYARKRDRERMEKKAKGKPVRDPTSYIMNGLETIEEKQQDGKYEDSLKIAKRVLKVVHGMSDDDLQNKAEITANIHSQMGNAYLEMGKYSQALEHHSKDRDIAQENDLEDAKSRALDNLGRVYARKGNYEKAIDLWKEKLPLSKSPLESTWLYHEIGRCYLELSDYKEAKDYGEKSIGCAKDADDNGWQLHATVLVAQAEVKMKDYQAAQESFEVALELSRITEDTAAEAAIKKALEDTKEKITQGYKEGEYSDEEEGVDGGGSPKSKGQSESKRPPSGDEESGADIDIPLMPASPVKRSAPSSPVKRSPEKMVRISPSPRASPTKNTHSPRKQSPTKGPESPKKGSPRGQSPSKKSVVSFKGDSPKGSARDAGKESPKMEDKGPTEETLEEKTPEPEVEKESQKEEIQREKSPEVEKEKETLKEEKAADSENVPEVEVEKEEQNEEQTPGQKSPQRTASPPKPSEEPLKSESKHSIKDDTKTDNVENGDKDTTVPSEEQTDQTEATQEAEKEAKKEES